MANFQQGAALVLFSGGQDSTVCLASALTRYDRVETIGFDYGQRHRVELDQRSKIIAALRDAFADWSAGLGEDHVLSLPTLAQISETSLTRDIAIEMTASGLPSTFVPGRNLLFFTYAAALAYRRGTRTSGTAVVVEGLNIAKRHTKPRQSSSQNDRTPRIQQGGILDLAQPLDVSKVMLVCPKCDRPTRIKHTTLTDGRRIRVCSHCGSPLEVKST